jgi:hypothetical protein
MSPSGEWLILRRGTAPAVLLADGKAERLAPAERYVQAVGFLRGDPVVGVLSMGGFMSARERESPSLLLTYEGGRWAPLLSEPVPSRAGEDDVMSAILDRGGTLLGDAECTLWVAQHYLYRIRRFSGAGKRLLDLQVGDGKPHDVADPDAARRQFLREAGRQGMAASSKAQAQAITAEEVVRAFTRRRDGTVYLLVKAGPGFALDRFDPGRGMVERTPLAFAAGDKIHSMAAGQDALYLAAYRGDQGRFRLPWEAVEAADWQPVEKVQVRTTAH